MWSRPATPPASARIRLKFPSPPSARGISIRTAPTAGSVANGGSYDWVSNSWTKTPGGTAATEASGPLRHVQFAATNPGSPLAYSVGLAGFSGAAHGFLSMRVTQGTVTFTGTPGNFYFTQPPAITADAGTTIRFAQTGALAFNLNNQNVTFDGAGTTLVSPDTVILNIGSITKSGTGTLVLAAPNTYNGTTTINGGTLRLAVTDLPALWLDATKSSSLALADGAASQWNDANGRGTFVSQSHRRQPPGAGHRQHARRPGQVAGRFRSIFRDPRKMDANGRSHDRHPRPVLGGENDQ